MDYVTIAIGFVLSCILLHVLFTLSGFGKPKNLPPGPTPLPIIGNLHLLGKLPHESITNLAKIHGPVMSLKFGRIPSVIISSVDAAREVLQKQDIACANRQIPDSVHVHDMPNFSVMWLPIEARWRNLRKIYKTQVFAGERLDAKQHLMTQKIEELLTFCRRSSQSGDAVDLGQAAFRTTFNLLSNTIFSKDLTDPYKDSAQDLKDLVVNMAMDAGKPNMADFFPALKMFDPQGLRKRMYNHFAKAFGIFEKLVNERLEMRKSRDYVQKNDLLDICLNMSEENPEFDRTQIKVMFLDFFAAGTDTTTSTITWTLAEVLRNPHTLAKAKEELEQVIGKGKMLKEADVSRLPYLQCIVKEALRMHPPAPFLLPRKVDKNIEINGYTIPKGTQVLVNAWSIGRDATLFEEPLEFKPERFLNSKLDVQGLHFELLPFGAGRRICPGMPLAMRLLPVIVGSLFNNFDWKLDGVADPKEMDMTEEYGITLEKAKPLRAIPIPLV